MLNKVMAVAVVAILISGCATDRYSYNNENFSTSAEALAAQSAHLNELLKEIKVRDQSIDANILVATPTKSTHVAVGIKRTGSPKQEILDYIGQSVEDSLQGMGRALQKSKAFTQVDLTLSDHTLKIARQQISKYSAIVYFHYISPSLFGWYLLKQGNEVPIQIHLDSVPTGAQKIESWINAVETAYNKK